MTRLTDERIAELRECAAWSAENEDRVSTSRYADDVSALLAERKALIDEVRRLEAEIADVQEARDALEKPYR